ncbi:MAG: hypothetical protein R3222_02965 [Balneolaceae bacterium]|nr:hypothetical protein [Balneolaceae bacterium]
MSYQLFYWIHIVSYLTWLAAFVASMLFAWKTGKAYQTEHESFFMKMERRATSIGAHIGALGILISGGAMASIPGGPKWGWFNFEDFAWLSVKQVLFFLILILVGISIKKSVAFKRKLKSENGDGEPVSDETRRLWHNAYKNSLIVYLLVLINTLLGLAKPF